MTLHNASSSAATDRLWDQLLQVIEAGLVIPVLGRDLLRVDVDGRRVDFYRYLAERLARKLGVPMDELAPHASLDAVVYRFLDERGGLEDVYPALKSVMPRRGELPLPEPLVKLASIGAFKLFVSTTFDALLAEAIDRERFGGREKAQVLAYSPRDVQDLPCPLPKLNRPTVFSLFGRVSPVPHSYALTDEDTLEFMHCLQSEARRPRLLLDELAQRPLLFIGCSFADWLTRFLIRIAKSDRLWIARGKTDVVADSMVSGDANLVQFLHHFSERTRVFAGAPIEFVDELHRRWTEQPRSTALSSEPPAAHAHGSPAMESGAVFLSYASEDLAAALAIRDALEGAGVDTWLDKSALEAGDEYEGKIKRNITNCSLFMPIISRRVLTAERRFFRIEWAHAIETARMVSPSSRFIVPVVIDDTSYNEPAVPEAFRRLHWDRLAGGQPTLDFVERIRDCYRQCQISNVTALAR
jgi:hypothetical protein